MNKTMFIILLLISASAFAVEPDPVDFSFAFFGCNRLNKDGVDATGSKSSANVAQLTQDFKELKKLSPNYVFLAGDIVIGLSEGDKKLKKQLKQWKKDFGSTKLETVIFTGNHEMLTKLKDRSAKTEVPNPPAYALWPKTMKDYIKGNDGPKNVAPNVDHLVTDESRLSYTFRSGPYFFMILNTDTMIDATTPGDIALAWIAEKLEAAQNDKKVKHIFVMGHKPIASPDNTQDKTGMETILEKQGGDFYALLNKHSKVRGYLSAHAHEWSYAPKLFDGNVPQLIAGNGGSPPEANWKGPDAYFGYTLVSIHKSGMVGAQSFGRSIPTPYYEQTAPASTLRESVTLYPGNLTGKH